MIDLHEESKRKGDIWYNMLFHRGYIAENIEDFIKNREHIKPTRTILPPGVFIFGKALITFKRPVIYRAESVSDPTGMMDVRAALNVRWSLGLHDGQMLYKAVFSYRPKSQNAPLLIGYDLESKI